MRLNFSGRLGDLMAGVRLLADELGYTLGSEGVDAESGDTVRVKAQRSEGPLEVIIERGEAVIRHRERVHFFRGLGLLVEALREGPSDEKRVHIVEEPQFDTLGVMIDASRNGVPSVDGVRFLLRRMALMGFNMLMLYTEDTYEIATVPYFGYLRGRYSHEELKACDDYAALLGIEMIPCIQTLGHLSEALKWPYAQRLKDTGDILLVGSDETYALIEEMIRSASAPLRTKRIHIGMDEAHALGTGRYLRLNGYRRKFDIMSEHLNRVLEITRKLGLKPMMWSDMYFRLASKRNLYYDPEATVPDDVIQAMPRDVQFVYWDYYHHDSEFYEEYIEKHRRFGSDPIFAGGIWTWLGFCPQQHKALEVTNASLEACKRKGIREVFVTLWGDNGTETPALAALPSLQLWAEHGFARHVDPEKLKRRFAVCAGGSYDAFMDLSLPDQPPGADRGPEDFANPSKWLLWQDVLIGLFDRHVERMGERIDVKGHYAGLVERFSEHKRENPAWAGLFEHYARLSAALGAKWDLGVRLRRHYRAGEREALRRIAEEELPEVRKKVDELRRAHRALWLSFYKPFGWEVLDLRYGGVLARLDTARERIRQYLDGAADRIEEFEEERLYFDGRRSEDDPALPFCNLHLRIATPGVV